MLPQEYRGEAVAVRFRATSISFSKRTGRENILRWLSAIPEHHQTDTVGSRCEVKLFYRIYTHMTVRPKDCRR